MSDSRENKSTNKASAEKPEWKKEERTIAGRLPTIRYENLNAANKISALLFEELGDGGGFAVYFYYGNLMSHNEVLSFKKKIQQLGFPIEIDLQNPTCVCKFLKNKVPPNFNLLMNLIDENQKIDSTTRTDIYTLIGVEEAVKEKALKLLAEGDLSDAADFAIAAQKEGYFSVIVVIIENLEKLYSDAIERKQSVAVKWVDIYNLCNKVIKENPYYANAKDKIAHMELLRKSESLDENDLSDATVNALKHALEADNSDLSAGMLSELSDLPFDTFKKIKVGCDADTIIDLGKRIRTLRKKESELDNVRKENSELKKQIALLENQLKTKNPSKSYKSMFEGNEKKQSSSTSSANIKRRRSY